jgi:hypothetical protein
VGFWAQIWQSAGNAEDFLELNQLQELQDLLSQKDYEI